VTVPPGRSFGPVAGLAVRRSPLPPEDLRTAHGFRCTTALRTAVDLARHEPVDDAVAAIDVLAHRGLVLADELVAAVAELPGGRGCRRARSVAALVDGRAESQPESRVRVLLVQAGLSPVPQHTVRDGEGRFVARVDLAFAELRVAVEYDGLWHAGGAQFRRDRRRLNALVAAGWVVLHLTAGDLHEPAATVARVRALLNRREIGERGAPPAILGPTTPMSG
jgi:G:T-mismatch repair DNA endonuclease (very short patch repair protein)